MKTWLRNAALRFTKMRKAQSKLKKYLSLKDKKAQIHLSESVAVIFIFFVLLFFGAIFYYNYQEVSFKEKQQELLSARAIDTTTKMLFLPEVSCTNQDSEAEPDCFDMMKVRHVQELFNKFNQTYFEMFSYAKISLDQVYPEPRQLTLYEKVPDQWKQKKPTFFVVALKDDQQGPDNYGYGFVTVEVYS